MEKNIVPEVEKDGFLNLLSFKRCRKQDKRIGGMNSLCFSLIHCEYIYTKVNLTFLIDFNFIRQVS